MARRGLMQATGPEPFMGAAQQPDYQMMAQTDPAQYYQQTPLMRAVWEGRLPTWVGQAFEQDIKPAYDAWDAPDPMTVQGALDYAAMPAKAVTGMGKELYGHIKEGVTNPTMKNAGILALDVAGLGGGLSRLGGVPDGALGANVWQGGPHRYGPEGAAQSLQHMGKGEGAQAYGWGRYDAGARDVGEQYRQNLAYNPDEMKVGGVQLNDYYNQINDRATRLPIKQATGEYEKMELVERLMQHEPLDDVAAYAKENLSPQTAEWFAKDVAPNYQSFGYLYKHDLPDEDIARYLDWDKPLSAQPESVRAALQPRLDDFNARAPEQYRVADPEGQQLYNIMGPQFPGEGIFSKQAASEALGRAGVPGLKYLDQGSRATTGGEIIDIFQEGGKWKSKIRVKDRSVAFQNAPTDVFTTSMPFDTKEAAEAWAKSKIGAGTRNYVTWDQDVLSRMKLLERNGESMTGLMQPDRRG